MDVLGAFKIIPVVSAAGISKLFLDEVNRDVKEDVQVGNRKREIAVFGVEDPVPESLGLSIIFDLRALICYVGIDVSVQKHMASCVQNFLHAGCGSVPVFGEKKGYKLRMYSLVASEISAQETAYEISIYGSVIAWKMNIFERSENAFKIISKFLDLSGFSSSVQAFKYYKHFCVIYTANIRNYPVPSNATKLFAIFAAMIDPERHIDIMGIVNLTDDSYYAPSRCGLHPKSMVRNALSAMEYMIDSGATIIDIGACSTRPGSQPVGAEEEWFRIRPVLRAAVARFPEMRFSLDTVYSDVIRKAYGEVSDALGADWARRCLIVNDISAGCDDPDMLPAVGELGLRYIAMHKRGNPATMQSLCEYDDVTAEVKAFFDEFAFFADVNGITDWTLDPGFGFAKTIEQNYQLLRELDVFSSCGVSEGERRKILVGVSRKSMIYKMLDIDPQDALPATQVLHLKALQNGADILRVHDVAEAARTVALYRVLR